MTPKLICPHGAQADCYRAFAHRTRNGSVEIDVGLVGTGDISLVMEPDLARALGRQLLDAAERPAPVRAPGWMGSITGWLGGTRCR